MAGDLSQGHVRMLVPRIDDSPGLERVYSARHICTEVGVTTVITPEMQYIGQHLKLVAFLAQSGVGVPSIVPTPRPRELKTHPFRARVPRDPINARRRDYRSVSSRRENIMRLA